MKVVVIGHPEAVEGFALVGVKGIVAQDKVSVNLAIDRILTDQEVGIVMVTNKTAQMISERMRLLRNQSDLPVFIEIPGPDGMDQNRLTLTEVANQAIGIKK